MIKQIGKFEFKENLAGYEIFKSKVPNLIAANTVNHFQEGFRKGGYQTDDSLSGWTDRQNKKRRSGRSFGAVLVDSGLLRRDIKKIVANFKSIIVGTSSLTNVYAERHNKGLSGMPKREFIGDSKKLEASNEQIIQKQMDKVMKI